jgi:hypothetical protein
MTDATPGSGAGIRDRRLKSVTAKALDVFLAAFIVLFVSVFAYGIVNYPDAPIRRCGVDQFCGKSHKLHTEQEFRDFSIWEAMLIYSFVPGFVAGNLLGWRTRRRASHDLEHLLAMQRELSPASEGRRYAAAWKDRRRRRIVAWVLLIPALTAVILRSNTGFPAPLLTTALVALAIGAFLWLNLFLCPRCGHEFLSRQSRVRCKFCGLRLGMTFEEALAESEAGRTNETGPRWRGT